MRKGEVQGPVASHGNSADGSSCAAGTDAVFSLDVRQEFLQKKVAVTHGVVGGVDVEAAMSLGGNDEKVVHLVLLAQIVEQSPTAAVKEGLLVVAQAVQKIENWIPLWGMLCCTRVIARGHVDAIVGYLFKDFAVQRAAVDAALRGCPASSDQNKQAAEAEGADHAVTLLVAQGLHRIEPGGARSRIQARNEAHQERENDRKHHQPPRDGPEMLRREALTFEIGVGSQVDNLADDPTQRAS